MNWKMYLLLMVGIWMGMLIGISFVEAPLKFRAPNMTLALGLGIGKLVFAALNKFEIAFSIVLLFWLMKEFNHLDFLSKLAFASIIFMVLLQSVWLLPILSARADQWIEGIEVAKSNHHWYYIAMELAKVVLLFYGFTKIYNYAGHS